MIDFLSRYILFEKSFTIWDVMNIIRLFLFAVSDYRWNERFFVFIFLLKISNTISIIFYDTILSLKQFPISFL